MNENDLSDIEPTDEELARIEAEDGDLIEDLAEDPIIFLLGNLEFEDYYEGEPVDLHNRISFKGIRLA